MLSDHRLVGAAFAVITSAVPDAMASPIEKIIIAVMTAFITGMAYKGGMLLTEWLRDRSGRPTESPPKNQG